jgi:hypothetical protein
MASGILLSLIKEREKRLGPFSFRFGLGEFFGLKVFVLGVGDAIVY